MSDPISRLDTRFSDSDTQPTPWAKTQQALENAQLFWVTTVRADGRPHATPLVAVWLDDTLHFCTGPEEQKARNLTANPQVILSTGTNRWDQGLDVMVEGRAERVTDRPALQRLATAWATKWNGEWQFTVTDKGFANDIGGDAYVYAVRPSKILAFGKGPFTQTTYRY